MLLKTMLLLINIAIIGALACLIVKLYYRDEERENQLENVDNIESELKGNVTIPAFENTSPKNERSTIASTKDRIMESTSRASKRIMHNQKEDPAELEKSLNKEIESLTITKAKTTKNSNVEVSKPKKAQVTTSTSQTENIPKVQKEEPKTESEPVSINAKNTTEEETTPKINTETTKTKFKTTLNKTETSDKPDTKEELTPTEDIPKVQKEEPKTEREPVSINAKNTTEEETTPKTETETVKTTLKTTVTKPETTDKPDNEEVVTSTEDIPKVQKEEPKTEREPVSINVKNTTEEETTKTETEVAKTSLKTTATKPEAVDNIANKEKVSVVEKLKEAQKEEEEEKTTIQTEPSETTKIKLEKTTIQTEPSKTIKIEEPTTSANSLINEIKEEKAQVGTGDRPSVKLEEKVSVKETPSTEAKEEISRMEISNTNEESTTPVSASNSEIKENITEPIEEKPTEEYVFDREKAAGIVSNISQEPIGEQHQTILNETRKITNETPEETLDSYIDDDIEQSLKEELEYQHEAEEFAKITDPIESVKDAFSNIRFAIKGKEETNKTEPATTNEVVLDEILNDNEIEINNQMDYNDEVVSITPLHDPEEIKKYEESMNQNYDAADVFDNIDVSTDEITPEEIEFFENLEKGYNPNQGQSIENLSPSEKFHRKNKTKKSNKTKQTKANRQTRKTRQSKQTKPRRLNKKPTLKPPIAVDEAIINIQGQDHILKRGKSIIYQHGGEKYGSSIHNINGDNLNVTYRGQKIWIKAEDVTKVF